MTRFLLDVVTVVALVDRHHKHHAAASAWAERTAGARWLTSPIVQNGAFRTLARDKYSQGLSGASAVVYAALGAFCAQPAHEFVTDDISLLDGTHVRDPGRLTPNNSTDIYLLALARRHDARFATFDHRIVASIVPDGERHIELVDA